MEKMVWWDGKVFRRVTGKGNGGGVQEEADALAKMARWDSGVEKMVWRCGEDYGVAKITGKVFRKR